MSKKASLICIIIGVIILGVGLFLNFNSSYEDEKTSDKVEEKEKVLEEKESLDINGDLTQGLYYMTISSWSRENNEKGLYHYKSDKLITSDFEKEHLYEIVFSRLQRKGLMMDEIISEELVINEFKEIFGSYVEYVRLNSFSFGCNFVNYEETSQGYRILYTNCIELSSVETKIISSYKYKDKVVIEEKVLFYKDGINYYDLDFSEVANVDIDEDDEKMLVYKYTFMYDDSLDRYYFYSIEK